MTGTIIAGGGRGLALALIIAEDGELQGMGMEVKALVEVNTSIHPRLRKILTEHGLPKTEVISTLEEALDKYGEDEAQSVFVATPNPTHARLTGLALAGNRHVFLEKPIAATWEDAAAIVRMAEKSDKTVCMGLLLRHSRFFAWIREIVGSGTLGNVVMINMNERLSLEHSSAYRRGWRRLSANSGGLVNEKCSHDIDIMCWLKEGQAKPVEVFSYGGDQMFARKETPSGKCSSCNDKACPFRRKISRLLRNSLYAHVLDVEMQNMCIFKTDADVFTHQSLTVIFSDGTQGTFNVTLYSGDADRDITIHGTEGYLAGSLNSGKFRLATYRDGKDVAYDTGVRENQHGGADTDIVKGFFETIAGNAPPTAQIYDGALSSRIAFAADLSAREGRKVALSEFPH